MFSLEQSLAILGDPALGDRLERIAFNALPGTFTDDMWAHQYNQEPNQVEVSLHRAPWTTDGPESNLYGLEPNFGCCTANFHQGWPKFAASLWMASHDDGLVAAAYSPSVVPTTVGNTPVHLTEETDYPFRGSVRITLNPATPVRFPLRLRVPDWAAGATIKINGEPSETPATGAGFAKLDRTWKPGDIVEIHFPMQPRLTAGYNGSVSVDRGPLVFSYPIGEVWVKLRTRGMTADWQVFPSSEWNYALAATPDTAHPASRAGAPHRRIALRPQRNPRHRPGHRPQAPRMARRRRRRRCRPAQPRHQRRTRGSDHPRPLRSRQAPHHVLPSPQHLSARI